MTIFKKITCFILLATSASAALSSVPMPGYQVPSNVAVFADGKLEVSFPVAFNGGCTTGEGKRLFVEVGNSQGVTEGALNQIQSIVLAAFIAGKPIKFWYDRRDTVCEGGKVAMEP